MIWHNDEAKALADRLRNIIRAWDGGVICPSEFLFQLDLVVNEAKAAKEKAARAERPQG